MRWGPQVSLRQTGPLRWGSEKAEAGAMLRGGDVGTHASNRGACSSLKGAASEGPLWMPSLDHITVKQG